LSQSPRNSGTGGSRRARGPGREGPRSLLGLAADAHLVPGERAVTELLRADSSRVSRLFVEKDRRIEPLIVLASACDPPILIEPVEREILENLVGRGLARGVVAVARPPKQWDLLELLQTIDARCASTSLLVVLDGVMDPHNFGAIIRSAEFFGADAVVQTQDRAAPLSTAAIRASAGGSERLPIARVTNLRRAIEETKSAGYWVVGTIVDGGKSFDEILAGDRPEKLVLVLGSEQKGLRPSTRKVCDFLATIEGRGTLGSLNVSSAAAVAIAMLTATRSGR